MCDPKSTTTTCLRQNLTLWDIERERENVGPVGMFEGYTQKCSEATFLNSVVKLLPHQCSGDHMVQGVGGGGVCQTHVKDPARPTEPTPGS